MQDSSLKRLARELRRADRLAEGGYDPDERFRLLARELREEDAAELAETERRERFQPPVSVPELPPEPGLLERAEASPTGRAFEELRANPQDQLGSQFSGTGDGLLGQASKRVGDKVFAARDAITEGVAEGVSQIGANFRQDAPGPPTPETLERAR